MKRKATDDISRKRKLPKTVPESNNNSVKKANVKKCINAQEDGNTKKINKTSKASTTNKYDKGRKLISSSTNDHSINDTNASVTASKETATSKKRKHDGHVGGAKQFKRKKTEEKTVKLTNREAHAKVKSDRTKRRENDRSHYEVTVELKKMWVEFKRLDLPVEEREKLCLSMMEAVKGKERDLIFAHDTSRVFESLCKYANKEQKKELFDSLRSSLLDMSKSKYSVFFVKSMMSNGDVSDRKYIVESLLSNAKQLLGHKIAGPVVEFAYNEYADVDQRLLLYKQFYGPSFQLFSTPNQTFDQFLQAKPEKKEAVLRFMKDALAGLVEKQVFQFTSVHKLLMEYLTHADTTERQVMAESLQEHLQHIAHTREGAKAAMFVIWYSSAKGRKVIMKQLKPFVEKLVVEEFGHKVLFALFDSVDDTKLENKLIVSEVTSRLETLVDDKWGRHVLFYLLKPRDPLHVNKEVRELLALGDGNPFTKKDPEVKQSELRAEMSPALLSFAIDNLDVLLSDNTRKVLLFAIIRYAEGNKQRLIEAVVALYNKPYTGQGEGHPLDDKGYRVVVRKTLQNDDSGDVVNCFLDGLSANVLSSYVETDQGCYFIAELINCSKGERKTKFIQQMSRHKSVVAKKKTNRPQELLLKALDG